MGSLIHTIDVLTLVILFLAFLASPIFLIIGLVSPKIIGYLLKKEKITRKQIALLFTSSTIICLVVFIFLDNHQAKSPEIKSTTHVQKQMQISDGSVQIITDSLNNEVNDNGVPTTNYKKYIDITEADFSFTNGNYDLILKTAANIPQTLSPNDEVNITVTIRNPNASNTINNDLIVFGSNDSNGGYSFTANAGGSAYANNHKAEHFLPGNYSVKGNFISISIPKSFIDKMGLSISPNNVEWEAQTQYESNTSNNPQLSANNFIPNNKDGWIKYSSTSKGSQSAITNATPQPVLPTDTPEPTATPVPHDANGFPEDYQNVTVADISKSPSDYNNKTIMFTCTVLSFPKDDSGNAAGINCSDPNDYSSIVQIDASNFDLTKINTDDTINVYGLGQGSADGKNAFGTDVSTSLVLGMYVNDVTSGYSNSK